MPEGHLAHRYAREHARGLAGRIAVASPQGRFAVEAAALDGRRIEGVEAYGKHLFYSWDDTSVVHVHLGLVGTFLHHRVPVPDPRGQVRLRMVGDGLTVDLVAPARCERIDPAGRDRVVERLGPDPLRGDADAEAVWQRIHRSRSPIGALLLDQSVVAGLGNVLRSETLHIAGISPTRPGDQVARADFDRWWHVLGETMRRATATGRITTVDPPAGTDPEGLADSDLRRVYKRERCARCGTVVQRWALAGRDVHACPACQPPPR